MVDGKRSTREPSPLHRSLYDPNDNISKLLLSVWGRSIDCTSDIKDCYSECFPVFSCSGLSGSRENCDVSSQEAQPTKVLHFYHRVLVSDSKEENLQL
jgi:hypothetical protein